MSADYLPLLWESAGTKTFWQTASDVRYFAMMAFGGFNMGLATLIAVIGATLGVSLNYVIGRVLSIFQFNGLSTIPQEKYLLWQRRLTLFMPLIGLVSFIHLIGVVVTAAGFLRVPPLRVLPFLLLGQILYYGYYFLNSAQF